MSKKIYRIKTIVEQDARVFDTVVNEAIADGWFLEKRYSAPLEEKGERRPLFIADLRRYEAQAEAVAEAEGPGAAPEA